MMKNNIMSKESSRAMSIILAFVMVVAMFLGVVPNGVLAAGNTYYVDSVNGNDSNGGTTSNSAWKSLDKVNNTTFTSGDKILLAAGSNWIGQLAPKGSGAEGSPIIIDMYGTGNKPKIDGNGTVNDAVLFYNQEYWEINNLEVTNRNVIEPDENQDAHWGDYRGVHITGGFNQGVNPVVLNHFRLNGIYVHDVSGEINWISGDVTNNEPGITFKTGWDGSKNTGGIVFNISGDSNTTVPTKFNDVIVENCVVKDSSFAGITFKQWDGEKGWGKRDSESSTTWTPNTNIIIKNNYVNQYNNSLACNGIYLTDAKDALIERNVVEKAGTCGIEAYYTDNVTIQYNEVYETTQKAGGADYAGIDPDKATTNTILQYNYVHDCGDGILLCQFSFGGSIVRYNVLVNNSRNYINLHANKGPHYIYNNTFYNNKSTTIFKFIGASGGASTVDYPVYIANNIFYSTGSDKSDPELLKVNSITYDNNLYYGPDVYADASDIHAIKLDPKFKDPGKGGGGKETTGPLLDSISGYGLQSGSPAIDAGYDTATKYDYTTTIIPYKNTTIKPTLDFAGKALYNGTSDVGAFEYYGDIATGVESIMGYTKDTYGNIIPGANVSVTGNGQTYTGLSDTAGFYSIQNIPLGTYTVTSTKTGYKNGNGNATVAAGNSSRMNLSLESLSTTGSITGTVADYSGNLISGATVTTTVSSQTYSAQTDAQGVYTLNDVPIGSPVNLTGSKSGYTDGQVTNIAIVPGATVQATQIKLTKLNPPVYVINDNFDALTAGTNFTGGSSTEAGWTATPASGTITVDNIGSLNNAVHMVKPSSPSGTTSLEKSGLNLTGIVTFEARVNETGASGTYFLSPYFYDSTGTNILSFYNKSGSLYAFNGSTGTDTGFKFSSGVWHTMKVVMDTNSDKYSLYMDDMNTPLTGFNNVAFRNAGANVDKIVFNATGTYTCNSYIDYIRLNSGLSYDKNDTDLSSLTLSSGALTKLDAYSYKADDVPNYADKVTVTPTTNSMFATITVNGVKVQSGQPSQELLLNEGQNTINIEATAEDGTVKNYIISVYRTLSAVDSSLKSLVLNQGTLTPSFASNVFDYSVSVPYVTSSITLQPIAGISNANITVNNVDVKSGEISQDIPLIVGDNEIKIVVGSTDGTAYSYYNIKVNRTVDTTIDVSQLETLYNENKDRQQGEYTDKTWTVFVNALESARIVLESSRSNSDQAGSLTQDDINGAIATLQAAIDGLRTAADGYVLIDEQFDSQTTPENFGFPLGTSIENGVLNVAKEMGNYTTSVKAFDETVYNQKKWIELSFDWKTVITTTNKKSGVEFRDSLGNLIFAICGTPTEFRYSYTGVQSDSSTTSEALSPTWMKITTGYRNSEWNNIRFKVNFETKTLEYSIVKKSTGETLASGTVNDIAANSLAKMVIANYYSAGVPSIDNFIVIGGEEIIAQPSEPSILQGKTVYAFGDSIVAGHKYPLGFVDFTAKDQGMTITKYAHNGAVIGLAATKPMGGYIVNHVEAASSVAPDYVVFNGGTNDAENIYNGGGTPLYEVGTLTAGKDPAAFDIATFAGSFEKTIYEMKQKWPSAKIVYVAVHKLGSRDWNAQLALREIELGACKKWGVTVADVFGDTDLDTRITEMKNTYTFDNLNSAGVPGVNGSGTHPNFAAINKYYESVLTTTLLNLEMGNGPIETVNKTDLQSLYENNKDKQQGSYTAESWETFTQALKKAQEVLADNEATQIVVDEAKGQLEVAVNGLTEDGTVNKLQLETLYNSHKDKEQGNYTKESWEVFTQALIKAQEVLADDEATQAAVDEAKDKLEVAVNGLTETGTEEPNTSENEIEKNVTVIGPEIDSTAQGTIYATVPKSVTSENDLDLLNPIEFKLKVTTSGGVEVIAIADEYVDWDINGNVATTSGAVQYFSDDYELEDPFEYEFKVTIDELITVDKNGLLSVIADAINKLAAAVEGIAAGQYKAGSKDILNNAINAAQGVYDDQDATQTQVNDAIAALRVAVTNFENSKVGSVTPPAPFVIRDDTTNKVYGMAAWMEYNLDGAGYVAYDAATFNAINFSGNHILLVRVAAEGNNPAGLETILTFTTNPTTGGSSDNDDDSDSDDDNDSDSSSSNNNSSNNGISSNPISTTVDTVKVEKSEGGMIKLVNTNGQVITGWQLVDGNWYLADINGIPKIGWQQVDGYWYLLKLDSNGAMATGWQQVNDTWYFLKDNGAMVTGWKQINGTWYLFKDNGVMATGWQETNRKWYYLYSNGAMASNTVIDGYKVDASGAWV